MMRTSKKQSELKAAKDFTGTAPKKSSRSAAGRGPKSLKGETELRDTFMQNILIKKQELERILERLIDGQREYDMQARGGDFTDELDQAQREIAASSYYPIIERKTKELKKIDFLISRMSKDEKFGRCEECGKRIPKERLFIIPEATLCVSCQRELEKMDLLKSGEARSNRRFGQDSGLDWDETEDSDEKSFRLVETQTEKFSINDIQETETENDALGNAKAH